MGIRRVWIEEGCIACNLCEDLVPEIFVVPPGDSCRPVKKHEKLLKKDETLHARVKEAAESCPVEVIQFEEE